MEICHYPFFLSLLGRERDDNFSEVTTLEHLTTGTLVKGIVLSFAGVEVLIPALLGSAVGQLYAEFSEAQVDSLIVVKDLPEATHPTIETSRRWAKAHYRGPVAYERAIQEALDE
jgi:hypothetical protein